MATATTVIMDAATVPTTAVSQVREMVNDFDFSEVGDALVRAALADWAFIETWNPFAGVDPAAVQFDYWGAASDVLLLLAAQYRSQVTVTASGQTMHLSDKALAAERQASLFAGRARVRVSDVERGDTWF